MYVCMHVYTVAIKRLHTPVKMPSFCDEKNKTKINIFRTFSTLCVCVYIYIYIYIYIICVYIHSILVLVNLIHQIKLNENEKCCKGN